MAEFVIKVRDVEEHGRRWEWPVTPAWLGAQLAGSELEAGPDAGKVDVTATRTGKDVIVVGRARATLVAACSRCLDEARIDADAELNLLLTARGDRHRPPADEVELTPEEIQREFFAGDEIVLDDVVREHLLLEVPMQPLCDEACAGPKGWERPAADPLAPGGIDPRLAPLLAFDRDD